MIDLSRPIRTPVELDGEWNMGIALKVPMAVSANGLLCSRGQIDVDEKAQPLHPGDPIAQTRACMAHLARVLKATGISPTQVQHINHYYVTRSIDDPSRFLTEIRAGLGLDDNTPITLVPLPYLYYPGIETETDFIASLNGPVKAVRFDSNDAGEFCASSGARGVFFSVRRLRLPPNTNLTIMDDLIAFLARHALPSAAGRVWVYVQAPDEPSYREIAERLQTSAPGWAIAVVPCIIPEVPEVGLTLSGFASPTLAVTTRTGNMSVLCFGDLAFLDFATPTPEPGERDTASRPVLVRQTKRLMDTVEAALAQAKLGFEHVLKATTYYVGDDTEDDLYANLQVRDGYYQHPGPASTGVPFTSLGRGDARLAVSLMLDATHLAYCGQTQDDN